MHHLYYSYNVSKYKMNCQQLFIRTITIFRNRSQIRVQGFKVAILSLTLNVER